MTMETKKEKQKDFDAVKFMRQVEILSIGKREE
jgi:hypothetical protein